MTAPAPRRILLLGASGFLGQEVARRLRVAHELRGTHCNNAVAAGSLCFDIYRDDLALLQLRDDDVVICCARLFDAGADAGDAAAEREQSFRRLLQRLARNRLLLLSTDAVFSGRAGRYAESAAREPVSAYGRRMCRFEDLVRAEVADHCIVRASYLYGYSAGRLDKRLADSLHRIERGERLEFFDDMYKSPLEVGQAADAVCALALSDFVGIVHAGGPRMSVYQFQSEALSALGVGAERAHPAAMPANSPLARDTSLDSTLMTDLTGVVPRGVDAALTCTGA